MKCSLQKPIFLLLLLICFIPIAYATQLTAEADFQNANAAVLVRHFDEAKAQYTALINSSGESANLDNNLAYTYAQLGDLGNARLYYERALLINPRLADARAGLTLVLEAAGVSSRPQNFLSFITHTLSLNECVLLASACFWLIVIALFLFKYKKFLLPYKTPIILLSAIGLLLSLSGMVEYHFMKDDAIIISNDAKVYIAPTAEAEIIQQIGPANLVELTGQKHNEYLQIKLPNSAIVWVPESNVKPIW